MKKELSPAMILGAIAAVVVAVVVGIVLLMRSDPAAQAPNPPPRFDPAAKESESHSAPGGISPVRGPNDAPPGGAARPGGAAPP